jgi:hypothetical protein
MSKKQNLRQAPTPLFTHLGLCPGAQPLLVTEYAERITSAWHKSVDSVFEMSRLCAEADEKLDDDDKKDLIARLPFDRVPGSLNLQKSAETNAFRTRKSACCCLTTTRCYTSWPVLPTMN